MISSRRYAFTVGGALAALPFTASAQTLSGVSAYGTRLAI